MKLCTYRTCNQTPRAGLVVDERVFDLELGLQATGEAVEGQGYHSLLAVLRHGPEGMVPIRQLFERLSLSPQGEQYHGFAHALPDVTLCAPLCRPNSIRDFMVFEEHLVNSTHAVAKRLYPPLSWINSVARGLTGASLLRPPKVWYELPVYYKGNPDSVVGPEAPILWPSYSDDLDYELEFGVYLWKTGKDITKEDAKSHIAGYTVFNDMSARDMQFREMAGRLGPAKGKDFDTGNVMGPYLVTPDEVGDPYHLEMRAFVNGELWSQGNSRRMHHSFEDMIVHVSRSETLHPGDFLGSGTVGTGCGLELGRKLKRGDRVTLEVEKLGSLSNPIANQ